MAKDSMLMTDVGGHQGLEYEAQQWLARLTSGEATVGDTTALKQWCARSPAHARAFAEANLLWDSLGAAALLPTISSASIPFPSGQARQSRRWFLGGAMAASVAGAGYLALRPPMKLWPTPQELAADYRTRTAERREIAVGDGVTVELNTRSSLNILHKPNERQIELLSGEAAISVPRGPMVFTVLAAGGTVRAADAQFNLRCEAGRSVVTCHRGEAALDYAGKSVRVTAGRQAIYVEGTVGAPVVVDPAVVMAWRDGQLVFRQTPLADVIDEVNRYRSGRIILVNEALGRRTVEARIPIDRVDDLIVLVRDAYGAKIASLPGGIVLLS